MSELTMEYWQLVQEKGDKVLVLLGKPKKSEIKKIVRNYVCGIIGIFIIAFVWISIQIYVTSMGYTISQLQKERSNMENLRRMLLVDMSSLCSSERIEKIATQMGLIIPDEVNFIYIPASQDLTQNEKVVKNPFPFLPSFFNARKAEAFGGESSK